MWYFTDASLWNWTSMLALKKHLRIKPSSAITFQQIMLVMQIGPLYEFLLSVSRPFRVHWYWSSLFFSPTDCCTNEERIWNHPAKPMVCVASFPCSTSGYTVSFIALLVRYTTLLVGEKMFAVKHRGF